MEVVVTTEAYETCKAAVKESPPATEQTNTQMFTERLLFALPNQQCQSTQGKQNSAKVWLAEKPAVFLISQPNFECYSADRCNHAVIPCSAE